jgi:hypothetical protein
MLNDEVNRGPGSEVCVAAKDELRLVGESRFAAFFAPPTGGNWTSGNPIRPIFHSPWLRQVVIDSTGDIHGLAIEIFYVGVDNAPAALSGRTAHTTRGFLGLLAPVIYVPAGDADGRAPQDDASIGVLGCGRILSSIETGEVKRELERLRSGGRLRNVVVHTPLRDRLNEVMTSADRGALYLLMAEAHCGVWHFASHVMRPGGVSIFELDNGAKIRALDFCEADCPPFNGQPLVFLNLCRTSVDSVTPERTLPELLAEKGAFGVIAPNLLVDESFATRFGNLFYAALFDAEKRLTVGRALVEARRAAWEQGYSAGLGYTLHAQEDFDVLDLVSARPVKEAA